MFQLREEHERAFQAAAMAAFERRAIAHIRARFPEQASLMTDDEIRGRVRDGIRKAAAYGLESERQGMCFVDTGFLLGPDFDSRPDTIWTRTLLNEADTGADRRANRLLAAAEHAAKEPA